MESWIDLFSAGKFSQCSKNLSDLLNSEKYEYTSVGDSGRRVHSLYIQHNKIICDALSHDWQPGESQQLLDAWGSTFNSLNNLCEILRCEQLTSNIPNELLLACTLNLLWWSWETLDPSSGFVHSVEQWIRYSLHTELSRCGENALDVENLIDLAEMSSFCLLRIPPRRCNIILDIILLYMLSSLRYERQAEYQKCLQILDGLLNILPQIKIHLSSENSPAERDGLPLLFLGPNVARCDSDADLSVTLVAVTNILFIVAMEDYDKAWHILKSGKNTISGKLQPFTEYLKGLVCFKKNDLDRALYHVRQMSATPAEPLMNKRKNALTGQIYFRKSDFKTALEHFCGRSNLSEEEDQLPLTVFFMARTYEALKCRPEQIAILECLTDALRKDPGHFLSRSNPSSSLQCRLVGCLHKQPEITLQQTLLATAKALIKDSRAKEASQLLLEALKMMKLGRELRRNEDRKSRSPALLKVIRDAATSLLMCGDKSNAQILCKALMDRRSEDEDSKFNRAVARMLMADVEATSQSKLEFLLESVKLLKAQKDENMRKNVETPSVVLIDLLISRAYYLSAKLRASLGLNKDADLNFRLAVTSNEDDADIIRSYKSHLIKIREADSPDLFVVRENESVCPELTITLAYLLHLKKQHD